MIRIYLLFFQMDNQVSQNHLLDRPGLKCHYYFININVFSLFFTCRFFGLLVYS